MFLKGSYRNKMLLVLAGLNLCTSIEAGQMGDTSFVPSWVASLSVGPVWEDSGKSQTFFLAPGIEKTYTADNSSHTLADGELFLGMQYPLNDCLLGQLGLAVAVAGNAKFSGEIWDDADPQFNNYTYSYKMIHSHVAVKGKLLLDNDYFVIPWISASLGVGFNKAKDFTSTPVIFEALPTPNFGDNTKTTFTYTLGAGVQRALNENWQVGIGYEFADWGKSQLSRATGQTMGQGLAQNHVYTNGFLINITYLA